MELVRTESRFRALSPAATDIFAYCASMLKIENRNTRFVAAIVDIHGTSARFSCFATAPSHAFEVWISASLDKTGGWSVSHAFTRSEMRTAQNAPEATEAPPQLPP